ncbi:molecular chaperone DnaK [Methanobrevibacter sp.]|uniref:molecular chaperone DnaK n=1 Tax=Methanobrevibacter sp. TaxID=66852 RepID=UPI0038669ECF
MSENERIIGIDLGTSNSAACVFIDGKPTIVPSAEGATVYGKAFPSYVAFTEDGDLLVGEPAKKQAITNPENTIKAIKRKMGSDYTVEIQGKEYTPQQISAFILQKIKRDTEAFLGEKITKAVITVPAYFDDNQRTATKDAGKIAGLDVLRLLNEPTAASLAYGLNKTSDEHINILVFDMGGGTLDVTIMEFGDEIFEVHSTSGNTQLGGKDMDFALKKYLADEFESEHGINLLDDSQADMRLEEAAERAKIELSNTVETEINLPFIAMDEDGQPLNLITTINRSKLESLVEEIVKRCGETIQRALDDAVMTSEDIDKVILVGGPTRMPMVQEYVELYLDKEVERGIDPMECVAQGAAIQAGVIDGVIGDLILVDVTPLSLGTEVADGSTSVIIPRNTAIPVKRSEIYSTVHDNQTGVNVSVVQGERKMADDNAQLGSFLLNGIPPAPRGVPQIEITYEIDADGILNVTAKEQSTGVNQSIIINATMKMSDSEIERAIEEANEYAEEDERKYRLAQLRNEADSAIYAAEKFIFDPEFRDEIAPSDIDRIETLIGELKQAVAMEDVVQITVKTKELNSATTEIGASFY